MNKLIIRYRLWRTIKKLEKLKEHQFNYSSFISMWEKSSLHRCPTVCCVAGYYPQWFPKAGLIYKCELYDGMDLKTKDIYVSDDNNSNVRIALQIYHGLPKEVISYLFFGVDMDLSLGEPEISILSNLPTVLAAFKFVYKNLDALLKLKD